MRSQGQAKEKDPGPSYSRKSFWPLRRLQGGHRKEKQKTGSGDPENIGGLDTGVKEGNHQVGDKMKWTQNIVIDSGSEGAQTGEYIDRSRKTEEQKSSGQPLPEIRKNP